MILQEFRDYFSRQLSGLYEPEEVQNLCFLTLDHVMNMNRVEVSLSRKLEIPPSKLQALTAITVRLAASEPIQYITGVTAFYGLDFQVNPSTLIPRPETEELVEWIITSVQNAPAGLKGQIPNNKTCTTKILDIGTGSGCIAIALFKNIGNAKVDAIDISQNALETAYQNGKANEVEIGFYHQDVLETTSFETAYDVIVSNPPYVRQLEKKQMRANVLSNEPDSALFVSDEDPLVFYRKIGQLAFLNLSNTGMLFFEINEFLGEEMISLLREIGFKKVELKKDMFGKDRMIKAAR